MLRETALYCTCQKLPVSSLLDIGTVTYIIVVMFYKDARQGIKDPESSEGSVAAQTVNVHLKERKNIPMNMVT